METWLYDEDRWPSGTAGGKVTAAPQYRMQFLRLKITDGDVFSYTNDLVAAFIVHLDGLSFTDKHRIQPGDDTHGKTVLAFFVEEMACDTFYNGFTYLDTMNRAATEQFIEMTHEEYRKHNGTHFGDSIYGIFTDEPHRGAVMNGFSNENDDSGFLVPYTGALFEEYIAAFGSDLRDDLPELFLCRNGEKMSPVKWRYMELTQRLFLHNYLEPIQDWCRKNRLLFTGHLLHEDSLTAQTCMLGSMLRAYEYMDAPGIDVLTEYNSAHWVAKQLQSVARQLDKPLRLSELYGCTGWQMDFEAHKAVGDWQALFGVNLRCPHLSWYSMKGEAKRDCPGSIFFQSAWYPQYHYIEDYFSRLHVLLGRGEPVCDLLVIYPVESLWARIYPRWAWMLETQDETVQKIEQIYTDTFRRLCAAKIDFDYGDEGILSRHAAVETENGVPIFRVGKMRYKSVLVTGMITMRKTTLELLHTFAEAGGHVVFAGTPPSYVDAQLSSAAKELSAVYVDRSELIESVGIISPVRVTDADGITIDDIYAQIHRDGDEYIAVLMNLNRTQTFQNVKITFQMSGYCEKWDVRTGERTLLAQGDPSALTMDFEPLRELCVVLTKQHHMLPPTMKSAPVLNTFSLGQEFSYRLHEPNVCVLDFAEIRVDGGDWEPRREILRIDRDIRTRVGLHPRSGTMLQPWFAGDTDNDIRCHLEMVFRFDIAQIPKELKMAIETPESFHIRVNGKCATAPCDGYWVDSCFSLLKIDTSVLCQGNNKIKLECDFRRNVDLEALYLLGDFGVAVDGSNVCLTAMPEKVKVGDLTTQGFPFYGAGISYLADVPKLASGQTAEINTVDFEAACILMATDKREQIIFAQPYRANVTDFIDNGQLELQYILTRRNTFGPLHYADLKDGTTDSSTFMAMGDKFLADSYGLRPQGMTDEVLLDILG